MSNSKNYLIVNYHKKNSLKQINVSRSFVTAAGFEPATLRAEI